MHCVSEVVHDCDVRECVKKQQTHDTPLFHFLNPHNLYPSSRRNERLSAKVEGLLPSGVNYDAWGCVRTLPLHVGKEKHTEARNSRMRPPSSMHVIAPRDAVHGDATRLHDALCAVRHGPHVLRDVGQANHIEQNGGAPHLHLDGVAIAWPIAPLVLQPTMPST